MKINVMNFCILILYAATLLNSFFFLQQNGLMLSEINHTEKDKNNFTYMWNLKNETNKTKQKQIHRNRDQTDGCPREREA